MYRKRKREIGMTKMEKGGSWALGGDFLRPPSQSKKHSICLMSVIGRPL